MNLAEKRFIPDHWSTIRPTTFVLWGVGIAIVGVALLLSDEL